MKRKKEKSSSVVTTQSNIGQRSAGNIEQRSASNIGQRSAGNIVTTQSNLEQRSADSSSARRPVVALIYDFDGTLAPGNMQEYGFIQATGLTAQEFWDKSSEMTAQQDASEILCYMKLMIDEATHKGISLKRENFNTFGSQVELFKGVEKWFELINQYCERRGLEVEHYINSSGLQEMVEGTSIAKYFKRIYACSFYYSPDGVAVWPAVAVDFTAKTQFLYMINKGVEFIKENKKVNEYKPDSERPVPFTQMIYLGDGSTDIPCMRLVKQNGGQSIAVYDPDNCEKKSDVERLISEGRVNFVAAADYRKGERLHSIVTTAIDKIANELKLHSFTLDQ